MLPRQFNSNKIWKNFFSLFVEMKPAIFNAARKTKTLEKTACVCILIRSMPMMWKSCRIRRSTCCISKKSDYDSRHGNAVREFSVQNKEVASFQVAYNIAKDSKSFSDGAFVKKNVLWKCWSTKWIDSFGTMLTTSLKGKLHHAKYISIALDESTDIRSAALLLIFVRGIDDNFKTLEQLAVVRHMNGRTTGNFFFKVYDSAASELDIDYCKLVSATTDGCPSMVENASGIVVHLARKVGALPGRHDPIVFLHCLINQEQICKSTLRMSHVTDMVTKSVKTLRKSQLKYRQLRDFLTGANQRFLCNKSKHRSHISNRHIDIILKIVTSNEKPKIRPIRMKWNKFGKI